MRIAPLQLGEVSFRRVSVELDVSRLPEDGSTPGNLRCDGVAIATSVNFSQLDDSDEGEHRFFVVLRVVIDNAPTDEADVRYSPYLVDIEAGAVVRTLPGADALGDIEDLVVVNGASMLWSAIREQVCNLTGRMVGTMMLPTVNFLDLKRGSQDKQSVSEPEPGDKPPASRKKAVPRKGKKQKE